MDIYNEEGWLFPKTEKNKIHYLNDSDIDDLLKLAENDDKWADNVFREVIKEGNHIGESRQDWYLHELRTLNAPGTVHRYPFGLAAITFHSRRHLFRGEPAIYESSIPSLNSKIKDKTEYEKRCGELCQSYV